MLNIRKLQLYRTENIGPVTYKSLLAKYSPEDALKKVHNMAAHGGNRHLSIPVI